METKAHIVVVDDEPDLRETVAEYLSMHGYRVTPASGGPEMRQVIEASPADLVILDINMPGEDGLSLARHLREHTRVGIMMLTAAGAVVDRIVGLEMGADDYIAKPVDLRELLARVKSVLRRTTAATAEPEVEADPDKVPFGRCFLNLAAHKLQEADGTEVALTSMEFDLLQAFARHPNRVLTRDQLLDLAHNRDWEPFDRSIDIRIARIRRKVEVDPAKPQAIKTMRGAGYMFVPGPVAKRSAP
jgi:two-component system phosphate regulon response regulator OmpR